jgi:hypothetical protein
LRVTLESVQPMVTINRSRFKSIGRCRSGAQEFARERFERSPLKGCRRPKSRRHKSRKERPNGAGHRPAKRRDEGHIYTAVSLLPCTCET